MDILRKILRSDSEHGAAVFGFRQSGVGLDRYGLRCRTSETLYERQHQVWAEPAVQPDCVNAKTLQYGGHAFDVSSGEQTSIVSERDGGDHRKG